MLFAYLNNVFSRKRQVMRDNRRQVLENRLKAFTETDDESNALEMMQSVMVDSKFVIKQKV